MRDLARLYAGWKVVSDPDPQGGFGPGALLDQHGVYHMLMMGHFTEGTVLERRGEDRAWRYRVKRGRDGKQALFGTTRKTPQWVFCGTLGPSNTRRSGHDGRRRSK